MALAFLKYEYVHLRGEAGSDLLHVLVWRLEFYNNRCSHKAFDGINLMGI